MDEERSALVESHIRLVHHIAKRYKDSGIRRDDIVSSGYFALIKAANTFDPMKGTKFSTYAGICINNEILVLLRRKRNKPLSLDNYVFQDKKGNTMTYADIYDDGERIEDAIIQRSEIEERKLIIGLYLINKSPRYAQIIKLRLQGKTHQTIAEEIGISKSYISRILSKIEKELTSLKSKIDKTDGEYLFKKYSCTDIARAKKALQQEEKIEWIIQIERSSIDLKNKSVHAYSPSVSFLQKGLCFNSDLVKLIDPDSDRLNIILTKISDTEGVLVFNFSDSDSLYFLQKGKTSGAHIESSGLTDWLFLHGVMPRRYTTCYYDETEQILYVKVECAQIEK